MTQEEKAKAYDEALKFLHKYDGANIMFTQDLKEEMFPEFKESKDERIRKELINFCKIAATGQSSILIEDANQFNRWAAWLEKQGKKDILDDAVVDSNEDGLIADTIKQGEQKPILDVEIPFGAKDSELEEVSYNIPNGYHAEIEDNKVVIKKGGQKPTDKIEPKFKVGQTIKKEGFNLGFTIVKIEDCFYYNDMGDYFPFTDQDNWELVEQKPAWSEDDKMLNKLFAVVSLYYDRSDNDLDKQSCISFLTSLKDKVLPQPKQEWSEEDEMIYQHCLAILHDYGYDNWLKSFYPQKQWKPTEEQIRVIERLRTCLLEDVRGNDVVILDNLLEQLKAL